MTALMDSSEDRFDSLLSIIDFISLQHFSISCNQGSGALFHQSIRVSPFHQNMHAGVSSFHQNRYICIYIYIYIYIYI